MPENALLLVGAAAIAAVFRAPLRYATVVLLAGVVVLPTTVPLLYGPGWLSLSRLLIWAFVLGLVVRARKGEIATASLRPTRVHLAFAAFLLAAAVCGIVLLPAGTPRFESLLIWLTLLDQALVLIAVIAAARELDPWWVARVVAVLAACLCAIAVAERYLGANWGHWIFQGTSGQFIGGTRQLSFRGGATRIRGPSQFALEFGWVCAVLVPVALVVASRARRWIAAAVPAVLVLAIVWTVSRSAVLGVGIAAAVTLVASRADRRIARLVVAGALVALVVFVQAGSLSDPFENVSADSAASRTRRFVLVAGEVDQRPLVGLGLAGPRSIGVFGTDTSYVLFYAAIGVIGLTAFLVLVLTTLLSVSRALRGPPCDERALAAAISASLVAGLIATAFFDHFTVAGSSRLFWILAAIGLTLAEETPATSLTPPGVARRTNIVARAALPLSGIAIGFGVAALAPEHTAWSARFNVLSVDAEQATERDPTFIGRVLINTTCGVVNSTPLPGVKVECREPRQASTIGELRIEGPDPATTARAADDLQRAMSVYAPVVRVFPTERSATGRPTWATTAPVWLGMAGLALALLAPRGAIAMRRR